MVARRLGFGWAIIGVVAAASLALASPSIAWAQNSAPVQNSAAPAAANDDAAWIAAQRQNTRSSYNAYLSLYPSGRHAAEARAAVAAQAASVAASAYSLDALNAQVRTAVISARAAEARGVASAAAGRRAAESARAAAQNARSNWPNHIVYNYENDAEYGRHYEGQMSNNDFNGYGVLTFSTGNFSGDRYEGEWANGNYQGAGVYYRAVNENNRTYNGLRYEGDYRNSERNGFGIFLWRGPGADGAGGHRYIGEMKAASRGGAGVMYFSDGTRYEGEWGDDDRTGFGVEWNAQGGVARQGIWTNGELTTPLTR